MIRTALLFLIFISTIPFQSFSQSTWTGAINNNWNDADNWNPTGVPGIGDDVIINSGDPNINSTPNAEINSLTMTGGNLELFLGLSLTINGSSNVGSGATFEKRGTLNLNSNLTIDGTLISSQSGIFGAGDLTINGTLNWEDGGSSVDITGQFLNTGTINIMSAILKTTLDNQGTVTQNGGNLVINDNGKYINNGVHDIQGNGDIGEDGTNFGFTNNGSLIKSAGTSRSDIQAEYDGSGSVEAQIGTIDFRGPSTQSGTLISSGGSIRFPTFTHSFSGVSIQGDGYTEVNGATVTIDSDVSATNFKFDGGNMSGVGDLTVTNSMIWIRGRFGNSVDAGQLILSNDFQTNETSGYLLGTTVVNNGSATWTGGQWVFETNGVFINNGTFDCQTDSDMDGTSKMITNNGTWTKSVGTFTTFISPTFTNNGTLSVEAGELRLFNGTNTGTITTTSGATLDFSGSTSTFSNESGGTIGGTGEITVDGNLVNNGTLSPGASPGILAIPGAAKLTFGSTSVIEMEIGGTTVGTEYDQIDLTGTFDLDGTLNVTLINSFNPSIGDSYELIKYTNHTGQFATINLPTIAGLALTVTDESGLVKLTISEENIAPVLDNSADLQLTAIDEDNNDSAGDLISGIETSTGITLITDPNGPLEGIAIVAIDNTNGVWQYSLDNGSLWTDFGSPLITSARLLLRDANTRIRFVPMSNFNGIVNSGITFHAWDQYLGALNGSTADITTNGGITPFSTESETISIAINAVNDAPTLSNAVADQQTSEGEVFSFTIPTNTFEDIDAGDMLSLGATLSDDTPLPSWLAFDESSFSGTPSNAEVGTITIKLTATDGGTLSVSDVFTLEVINVNDAPTVINPIADQQTNEDEVFNFSIPSNTFEDIDAGDVLSFDATLSDDSALPIWLNFDGTAFSGTPTNDEVGTIILKLTATDGSAVSVSEEFNLEILNVNDVPILELPIEDQTTEGGKAFSFSFPENTFLDVDVNDALTYSAILSNDNILPDWLSFDNTTRTFSGTPENVEASYSIKVIASDNAQATVSDEFEINVSLVLSAEDVKNQFQVLAVPNPFANEYQLQLENAPLGKIGIEIFDAVGRRVYSNDFTNNRTNHQQSIDLSNELSGIYVLTITHAKGSQSRRVVKK